MPARAMSSPAAGVETPSGKGAGDENFPVGSFLLPRRLRPKVALFYAYARAIDDIADNPALDPDEKVARLDGFDRALCGETDDPAYIRAHRVRAAMGGTGQIVRHCRDLIVAFKQDAVKSRYDSWDDLMGYCRYSAAPVGRFLIDLHGGPERAWPAADALCNALQIVNHLQDCADDYRTLDRVYLPGDWMAAEGAAVADLAAAAMSPGLRRVKDRCLDGIDALLDEARPLMELLHSRRLAFESAAIHALARALSKRLRAGDPVARRIELSKPRAGLVVAGGALGELGRRWMARPRVPTPGS